MMTSTLPGSRSGSSQSLKGNLQDIQSKRDALISLEAALKRRINEFKELCLKEGEITGQLPVDYPLQPREPIPQVRRRTYHSNSNSNLNDANGISPSASVSSSHKIEPVQPQAAYAISSGGQVIFPPRPMSTNSTSSSISTASSNTRSINNQQHTNMLATPKISSSSSRNGRSNGAQPMRNVALPSNHLAVQYDYSPMQTTRFKRPQDLPSSNYDADSSGLMRASSTASSSSSSGSATSSTLSTATIPNTRTAPKLNESSSLRALQHINVAGKGSFVPYYEETKPFQMSDFYKYSSKHRHKMVISEPPTPTKTKTTRQLQEDVKKNSLKYSSCDDKKIQNSMKIIEKSGQKLIEATAKAIAVNPGLADKLNSIFPNNGDKY